MEAPGGCTQYHFGKEGILKSFNFEGIQYLGNQNYKICIGSVTGACYLKVEADLNHFMLQVSRINDAFRKCCSFHNFSLKLHPVPGNSRFSRYSRTEGRAPSGRGDEDCSIDYLMIPGGRGNQSNVGTTVDRFCGGQLNFVSNEKRSDPIYSEVKSSVIWLQFVTGIRDRNFFETIDRRRTALNGDFEGTGHGIRLRYSQLTDCKERRFYQ